MYFLYGILLSIGMAALLPRFIFDAIRHGKYVAGLSERLGRIPPIRAGERPVIWLHCVSVGETQAARPLVRALCERYPSHALVVSTTTLTGQRLAREVFREHAQAIFYFPFDWALSVRRALRAVDPAAVLIMETELWPRFLRECHAGCVPVALINGRLSERSARGYRRIKRFISRVVNDLTLAIMQSEADAERIRSLGLDPGRIRVSGNIKFDLELAAGESPLTAELRERFRINGARPLIIAASTHAPEERIIIEALKKLGAARPEDRARLLIAPRHPERFAEAASLLEASGLTWARRSAAPAANDPTCSAILLDTIGELRAVYPLATLVFVGGSIAPTGGHNVLEPAAAGACIITGPHTHNFASIIRGFRQAEALVQLPEMAHSEAPGALARVFAELLADAGRRQQIGARARAVLEANRGATARTIEMLGPLLEQSIRRWRPDAEAARVSAGF